jgi:hypothetical protein
MPVTYIRRGFMREIESMRLVGSTMISDFDSKVQRLIDEGFEPYGALEVIVANSMCFYHSILMVRYKKEGGTKYATYPDV